MSSIKFNSNEDSLKWLTDVNELLLLDKFMLAFDKWSFGIESLNKIEWEHLFTGLKLFYVLFKKNDHKNINIFLKIIFRQNIIFGDLIIREIQWLTSKDPDLYSQITKYLFDLSPYCPFHCMPDFESANEITSNFLWIGLCGEYLTHDKTYEDSLVFILKNVDFYMIGKILDNIVNNKNLSYLKKHSTAILNKNYHDMKLESLFNFSLVLWTYNPTLCYLTLNRIVNQNDNPEDSIYKSSKFILSKRFERTNFPFFIKNNRKLKIAICISGQLRGYKSAHNSWNNLALEGHDVTTFVDVWSGIGRKFPSVIHTERTFSNNFLNEFKRVFNNNSISEITENYPNFSRLLNRDQVISIEEIRNFYKTEFINIENGNDPKFDNFNNAQKMYYKINSCHNLMSSISSDYDIVIRIRPDKFINGKFSGDWFNILNNSRISNVIYSDVSANLKFWLKLIIGDQIAIGAYEAMSNYANTYSFSKTELAKDLLLYPHYYDGHENLAWTCLYNGLIVDNLENGLGISGGHLCDPGLIERELILESLELDVSSRVMSKNDESLIKSIKLDIANSHIE